MGEGDGHYTSGEAYAGVPAEAKATVAKHATQADTVNAYHELSQKLGSSFRLPDTAEGLTPEQKTELTAKFSSYNLQGVPETAEGYEFTPADGIEHDAERVGNFKQFCLDNKIPPELAKKLVALNDADMNAFSAKNAEALKANIDAGNLELNAAGWDKTEDTGDMSKVQTMLAHYITNGFKSEEADIQAKCQSLAEAMDRTELGNQAPLLVALKGMYGDLIAEGKTFASAEQKGEAQGGLTYPAMNAAQK